MELSDKIHGLDIFLMCFLVFVFFATIITLIKEPILRFKKWHLKIDYGIAPVISVLLLTILGFVNWNTIISALLGNGDLVPWQIIVIFFTVAYIFVSLDTTGLLEYFSFKIISLIKSDGKKLFFVLIAITAVFTTFTSNDIVTLTMTPIVLYLSRHSKINPIPYLIAVFFTSNIWSMIFYIGSPTNIIVAQALNLGFIEYTKYMIIPAITAGVLATFLTYLVFKKELGQKIESVEKLNPEHYLRNKVAAKFGFVLVVLLFFFLLTSDLFGFEIWKITASFAIIYFIFNLVLSYYYWKVNHVSHPYHKEKTENIMRAHNTKFKINEFFLSLHRMPWKILPLITSFFIMVHILSIYGFTDLLVGLLNSFNGIFSGTIFTGMFSAIIANIMIDQPMAMFFSSALLSPDYLATGIEKISNGLALVIGSDLGDNLTIYGALAGIMWVKILRFNDVEMNYKKFLSYSIKIIPITIVITCLVLAFQMYLLK